MTVRQSLGKLATLIPVTGSFTDYAERFVDDSLAFALGWAYWYLWVTVSRTEECLNMYLSGGLQVHEIQSP